MASKESLDKLFQQRDKLSELILETGNDELMETYLVYQELKNICNQETLDEWSGLAKQSKEQEG